MVSAWRMAAVAIVTTSVLVLAGSAAGQEGEVLFYSSLGTGAQTQLVQALGEKYPRIKINWVRSGGTGIFTRLITERQAGKGMVDLFHSSFASGFYDLAERGWLLPVTSSEAKAYASEYKDPDGNWLALRASTVWLIYNSRKVTDAEAPKKWTDFLEPKWKGRIALPDPAESGGVFAWFYAMRQKYGPEFLTKLGQNQPMIRRGMDSVLETVVTGERDVGLAFEYFPLARMQKGEPVKMHFPEDGAPVVPGPIALMKGGPNLMGTQAVFDYIVSKEGQTIVAKALRTYSARSDVPAPPALPPLSGLNLIHLNWKKVHEESGQLIPEINRAMQGR